MRDHFLILAHARSGSTSLAEMFESQGYAVSFEPFNAHNHRGTNYIDMWGRQGFEAAFDAVLAEHRGVKHLYSFTTHEQTSYMKSRCRTIFLYRNNLLDAAVSLEMAFKTNVWRSAQRQPRYCEQRMRIDVDKVRSAVSHLRRHRANLDGECLPVSYEGLYLKDGMKAVRQIFDFAGCLVADERKIERILRDNKLNVLPWSETVENWDEIAAADFGDVNFM